MSNILAALQCEISIVDSAIGGLGGCPYAKGASGNVATEDVLYLLNGLQIETGVNMETLLEASQHVTGMLKRPVQSKAALALLNKKLDGAMN